MNTKHQSPVSQPESLAQLLSKAHSDLIDHLAGLTIWGYDQDDGTPYEEGGENFEPDDGYEDSHMALMELIELAREVQKMKAAADAEPVAEPDIEQVVVFASEGLVRSVAKRKVPAGSEACIVVDYDDCDVTAEAEMEFEIERVGCSSEEFKKTATFIW